MSRGETASTADPKPLEAARRSEPRWLLVRSLWRADDTSCTGLTPGQTITIGRSRSCDVRVTDGLVSGAHCAIEVEQNGQRIRDDSKHGTFVGSTYLKTDTLELRDGVLVLLGTTTLCVVSGSEDFAHALLKFKGFHGEHSLPVLREAFGVARSEIPIHIRGETGTGKELVARWIHDVSDRSTAPFSVVHCAALPETVLISHLFGHAKGAFTGAGGNNAGLIGAADGGTVFLDEVVELPLDVQAALLRVSESGEVTPVGGGNKTVDVRMLSACHADLRARVRAGRFREDLYQRLAGGTLGLPSARERSDELGPVFLRHCGREDVYLRKDVLLALLDHDWPGNLRELKNLAHQVGIREVTPAAVRDFIASHRTTLSEKLPRGSAAQSLPQTMESAVQLMRQSEGDKTWTRKTLGIGDKRLRQLLNQARLAGVDFPEKSPGRPRKKT